MRENRHHKTTDEVLPHAASSAHFAGVRRFKVEKLYRSCRKERRGAAVVEFAIVAPVFIIMILGMMEAGRAVMVQQIITNASREGARVAVLDGIGSTFADVEAAVKARVVSYLGDASITITTGDVTVTENPPVPPDYADSMTVSVAVPFSQVSWLPSPIYFTGARGTLSAATTMRKESASSGS